MTTVRDRVSEGVQGVRIYILYAVCVCVCVCIVSGGEQTGGGGVLRWKTGGRTLNGVAHAVRGYKGQPPPLAGSILI